MDESSVKCRWCNCDIVTMYKMEVTGAYVYTLYCTVLASYPHSHEVFCQVDDVKCDECGGEQSIAYPVSTYNYWEI